MLFDDIANQIKDSLLGKLPSDFQVIVKESTESVAELTVRLLIPCYDQIKIDLDFPHPALIDISPTMLFEHVSEYLLLQFWNYARKDYKILVYDYQNRRLDIDQNEKDKLIINPLHSGFFSWLLDRTKSYPKITGVRAVY